MKRYTLAGKTDLLLYNEENTENVHKITIYTTNKWSQFIWSQHAWSHVMVSILGNVNIRDTYYVALQ